jgi:hypothetical protein
MAVWGSNHKYGDSLYKDIPAGTVSPEAISVGMIGGHLVSFTLAILPTQGVGFSENTGQDFVFPFEACSGFSVIDEDGNERHIVVDSRDRKLYDIATKAGPENTAQVKRWKDKQLPDGTGGTDVILKVRFFDDLGTYENFTLRNATNHFFGRCVDPVNRGADGFDSEGFLTGTEWTMKMFIDGEKLIASRTSSNIPLVSNNHFGGHDNAHRIAIELSANKSGHMITGRKQEYVITDKYVGDNISNENDVSQSLSECAVWYSRFPTGILPSGNGSLIDRVSGIILSERNAGSTTLNSPPLNLGGHSVYTNDKIFLSGQHSFLMFFGSLVDSIYADAVELTPVEFGTYEDFTLYVIADIPTSTDITIRPAAAPGSYCVAYDIRQYDTALTDEQIAFYFDNMVNHEGDVVLP